MKKIKYYLKIWWIFVRYELSRWTVSKRVFLVFLFGKTVRYVAYFGFLYYLLRGSGGFAGYSQNQILFFLSTYILVDTVAQFFFRSVYGFRPLVVSGDLDLVLVKPINSLFRLLMGAPDPMDIVTIPPIMFVVFVIGKTLNPAPLEILYYIILILNALLIAAAFHIFVMAVGILTTEVDHTIMIYRDLASMGRFPIEIYSEPIRSLLTFIVPVGIMVTVPVKAISGLISPVGVILAIVFGVFQFLSSIKFWNFSLKKYTSASS